jgi:hypothetical protein
MDMSFLAAIKALQDDDMGNFEVAIAPGGIERQEAQGQADFVANNTLPIKCNYCKRSELEGMGIVFGEPVDSLFIAVQLPPGWKKQRTDHSMWSELLDDKGRKRASIFYKAAFYDRDAFIDTIRRYSFQVQPVGGYEGDYKSREWEAIATDCDEPVWHSGKLRPEPPYRSGDSQEARVEWLFWQDQKDTLGGLAEAWLDENKPKWRDVLAYWD